MTSKELYKKYFGDVESIPREAAINLIDAFRGLLELERTVKKGEEGVSSTNWLMKRDWLADRIDEVVDENQVLDSLAIADGIIEHWKENESVDKLQKLLEYRDRYEITIQFARYTTKVTIANNGEDLACFGFGKEYAIKAALEYLDRINGKND